jgi:hypothetical protein
MCNNLVEGGYDDWRLPTVAEMRASALNGLKDAVRLAGRSDSQVHWSSERKNPNNGYAVSLRLGTPPSVHSAKSAYLFAICVR